MENIFLYIILLRFWASIRTPITLLGLCLGWKGQCICCVARGRGGEERVGEGRGGEGRGGEGRGGEGGGGEGEEG